MPKDKKAKTAAKKLRVAQKTEKKAAQKEKKALKNPKSGSKDDASSDEDDATDLDAILASYAAQQEQFLKVTETLLDAAPSPRTSATFLASPSNDNEMLLFGGEYFDGALARFYNDLCIYNVNRDEWRLVTSPNSPLPRSGHAWCRGGNAGGVYLFGGEFSSPKQGTFYHYNDFWKLDPSTREWTKLEGSAKGRGQGGAQAPSARSGHRMTYFKNYIVLFGGFQDTSHQTKYLNDLWVYDCQNFVWYSPALPPASQRPEPRSSFSLLPHESGAVLYGGYSRVKVATATRPTKGGKGAQRDIMKPLVHQDTWFLRITPPPQETSSTTPPTVRWERRKRSANAPNPARAGATMAYHRGRGIQFGGVHDVEQSEEGIDSEFFNTLYVWNIDRNRFFPLGLRRPRIGKKASMAAVEKTKRGRAKADEQELLKNLASLELQHGTGNTNDGKEAENPESDPESEPEELKIEKPVLWEMPHARFNAQLAVSQNDILYIFGGTFEKGDREFTLDEMYAIDLGKLDGVKEIFSRQGEDWLGSEDEDEDDDDDDEQGYSDGSEEGEDPDAEAEIIGQDKSTDLADTFQSPAVASKSAMPQTNTVGDDERDDVQNISIDVNEAPDDRFPQPRPFESLKDFYARTSEEWQAIVLDNSQERSGISSKSVKEVRKIAFERAEEKWWDSREYIQQLENEQEEAGIGEIVSLTEKAANSVGGANRRR